ncbi:MAG: hypothetical protein JNK24_03195 [Alphaproteobacteria bacterium]|nr:hypothetical protein [Alphaproteobacteria bacterium]
MAQKQPLKTILKKAESVRLDQVSGVQLPYQDPASSAGLRNLTDGEAAGSIFAQALTF